MQRSEWFIRMSLFLLALLAAPMALRADAISVEVSAEPFRKAGKPGLQTRAIIVSDYGAQNFEPMTFPLSFEGYDTLTVTLFGLVSYDLPFDDDDLIPQDITVTFDFGELAGAYELRGRSAAVIAGDQSYAVAWFPSVEVDIDEERRVLVELSDTVFGINGDGEPTDGRDGVGFVKATFTLLEPSP